MRWDDAIALCHQLQAGEVSAVEVMAETYARIEAVNPQVNAIVNLLPRDHAMRLAEAADKVPTAARGPLHGLPWATKDAVQVSGFPQTQGFVPFADRIPTSDDKLAARIRSAGALFIGRTNMPEFGLGSNTFNALFGATRNPYDTTRTCGGSSGGAAVALATGMLPLADGSDMGGSLRNPASFCNVVGFRPSLGRMPAPAGAGWHARLSTTGPMGRTVRDTAYLFTVIAGPDAEDPLTLPDEGSTFSAALEPHKDLSGLRLALSVDLGGLPVDPDVVAVIRDAGRQLAGLGATVVEAEPPLAGAMDVFQVQRALNLANLADTLEREVPGWRAHAKESAAWNIDKGLALSNREIRRAENRRAAIYRDMAAFSADFDALILPAAQVPAFPLSQEYPTAINGEQLATYIDWMSVCCMITVTGYPAISVPAGFTPAGLPVGLQIVGRANADLDVLKIAGCFEAATGHGARQPAIHAFDRGD